MEKAVLDRIVDGRTAVILVGEDEREFHLPAERLPSGAVEGSWLRVEISGSQIVSIEVDPEETESVRRRVQQKMDQLRARGRRTDRRIG